MGHRVEARCITCGRKFTVDHGGGFSFHLVRCDRCGKSKSVGFDELGDIHQRYLNDLPRSSEQYDENEASYHREIEAFAGKCKCGGKYTFDALPRCPKCLSTQIEESEPIIMYD
jgi:hypothetical protein